MLDFGLEIFYFFLLTCSTFPATIYLLKVNNRNRTRCEICSELTIKTPELRQWRLQTVCTTATFGFCKSHFEIMDIVLDVQLNCSHLHFFANKPKVPLHFFLHPYSSTYFINFLCVFSHTIHKLRQIINSW